MKTTFTKFLRIIKPLLLLYFLFSFSSYAQYKYEYESQLGAGSQGKTQFTESSGIAVDAVGNLYVADQINNTIYKFDNEGNLLSRIFWKNPVNGYYLQPRGITVDNENNILITDAQFDFIKKINQAGEFVSQWGKWGAKEGEFSAADELATDTEGNIYVVDRQNNRIQKLSSDGQFMLQFGSEGSGTGQLRYPSDVALDAAGNVYVADAGNHRVQKFDRDGKYVLQIGAMDGLAGPTGVAVDQEGSIYITDWYNDRIRKYNSNGQLILQFGSEGKGTGQFEYPDDIVVDKDGFIYVAENQKGRVQKFNKDGKFVLQYGVLGNEDGQFNQPRGITMGTDEILFVVDSQNNRVQKFDSKGSLIMKFGSSGSGAGQLSRPSDVAINSTGFLYVADWGNNRIQKFDDKGQFVMQFGSYGTGEGQFWAPSGIAIDAEGSIYVVERQNNRVQKFDKDGNFLLQFGSYGKAQGKFDYPVDIAMDVAGAIYVADWGNNRIQKFDKSGNFIAQIGSYGTENGFLRSPSDVVVDDEGYIYVTDAGNNRVQKYDREGEFVMQMGKRGYENEDFMQPMGITLGNNGSLYIADTYNHRIQKFSRTPVPVIEISQDGNSIINSGVYNFGDISLPANTKTIWFKVENKGAAPLDLVGMGLTGVNADEFKVDLTGTASPLAPGASTAFMVTFSPSGAGTRIANLSLSNGDADRSPYLINLVGTGIKSTPSLENYQNFTKKFGDAPFDLGATSNSTGVITYSILPGGGSPISLTGEGNKEVTILKSGTVVIRATISEDANYSSTYKDIILTINKASQTIALQAPDNKTYGDAVVSLPASSTANLSISYAVTGPAMLTGTAANPQLAITGAGTVRLTATQAGNEQYEAAPPIEHTFTVAKKELTVRADNKSRVYDQTNLQLTYTLDGFVNGESTSVLEAAPVAATTAMLNSNVGTYPITLSGGQAANYSFAYHAAVLTITKAEATLTVSNLEQQYDGQAKQVTVVTAPQDLAVRVTYNGSETLPVAAGTYNVVVTVVDVNYAGTASATLNILNSTSIADVKVAGNNVMLYPNPTVEGRIAVDGLKQSQKVHVSIIDASGRKVWQEQTSTNSNGILQLDLGSKVPTGLYFIQISEGQNKPKVLKFIRK